MGQARAGGGVRRERDARMLTGMLCHSRGGGGGVGQAREGKRTGHWCEMVGCTRSLPPIVALAASTVRTMSFMFVGPYQVVLQGESVGWWGTWTCSHLAVEVVMPIAL